MSGVQRNAAKSGMFLIIAAALLWLSWVYQPAFFIPVMFIIALVLLIIGAQSLESWEQRRKTGGSKTGSKATAAQRRRAAEPAGGSDEKPAKRRRLRRGDKRRSEQLPPEATVTLAAEREETNVDELFDALNHELVGLVPVKKKIEEIAALLLVDRVRQRFGLEAPRPNLHMCFTGAPGTGKTTVALKMADLLHRLGYLEEGHLVHAMRNDLVGQYIGHTAPRTRRMLDQAMGGVLFIDEAYYLYRGSDPQDFGQEAIDILLQVMENDRDKLVVILAGYHGRMEEFFESNPGMRSRIAHHIDFATYELDELVAIGRGMLQESRYYLSAKAETTLREYLTRQMQQPEFANARSVRNEMERARLRHAHRLATDLHRGWNRDDLMRIEPVDIWASDMLSLSATGRTPGQRGNE